MGGKVETIKRIAVIASSPDIEGEVLLGIPAVPTSSGANQVGGILPLIEKYEIADNIFSVNIDSTASNTGRWAGSATLLQKQIDSPDVWIVCHHHLVETLARHGFDAIRGVTASPFERHHNEFQSKWNTISELIDHTQLNKFDWNAVLGTPLEVQAREALEFCKHALHTNTFTRGDYKELCELIVVFLGGHVAGFTFKRPGACHHAKFVAQAIYSTKMA